MKYEREKHTAYMKSYYLANPHKLQANRRHLKAVRLSRKQRLVDLKGGCCMDCGFKTHLAALEFDHRDPATKLAAVATLAHRTWETMAAEVEKCDLVCSNCHAIRTWARHQPSSSDCMGIGLEIL